ncbi:hypothetical protein SSX86_013886 [Deinandra increscens subsp. villosa]|uniref:Exonuclease domain-containing protein n=1 Tax=Deinandra increscens subsp. villosa TaxID=3103831 RepID=A0AAP0D8F0_9ASTR
MGSSGVDRSEMVFFDLETTIPPRLGHAYAILEFGSILVCPKKLTELDSYCTLVRPLDLSLISPASIRSNGITADDVVSSPTFSEIADKVYDILNGRVWVGHNIDMFDCARLKEAYEQINRPPPVPKRTIDTLTLLTQTFGRRAGNMKMASLAAYFGLGKQSHRSLADIRMNLEVVKLCATVLFLESSQQDTENNQASPNASTITSSNRNSSLEGAGLNISPLSSTVNHTLPPNLPSPSVNKKESDTLQSNEAMVGGLSSTIASNALSSHTEFIDPDSVSLASITVTVAPFSKGPNRIQILHRGIPMQIRCDGMKIQSGLTTQFVDHVGNPSPSFVVDANCSKLGNILDACDNIAKSFVDSDGNSEWGPVVSRKPDSNNSPTIRLHLLTAVEDASKWITEVYYKNSSSILSTQQLVSSQYAEVAEVDSLFRPGALVDAYFSVDPYSFQQNAGIRLVAKKLIIHST